VSRELDQSTKPKTLAPCATASINFLPGGVLVVANTHASFGSHPLGELLEADRPASCQLTSDRQCSSEVCGEVIGFLRA
jgi:hypothetical protein